MQGLLFEADRRQEFEAEEMTKRKTFAEFTIPYPQTKKGKSAFCRRFGLNAYYAGKHWAQRKKDAEWLHELAWIGMKKANIRKKLVAKPVEISFFWDDGLDADNHAVLGKAFVDAMVQYILPDDNRRWVKFVSHGFWDRGCIGVKIQEVEEAMP